jgi:hypothetical protein
MNVSLPEIKFYIDEYAIARVPHEVVVNTMAIIRNHIPESFAQYGVTFPTILIDGVLPTTMECHGYCLRTDGLYDIEVTCKANSCHAFHAKCVIKSESEYAIVITGRELFNIDIINYSNIALAGPTYEIHRASIVCDRKYIDAIQFDSKYSTADLHHEIRTYVYPVSESIHEVLYDPSKDCLFIHTTANPDVITLVEKDNRSIRSEVKPNKIVVHF